MQAHSGLLPPWEKKGVASFFPLEDGWTRVRHANIDDLSIAAKIEFDPETKKFMPLPRRCGQPLTVAQWTKLNEEAFSTGSTPYYVVEDVDTKVVVGRCGMNTRTEVRACQRDKWTDIQRQIDMNNQIPDLEIVIASWVERSRHHGSTVARALMRIAFEDWGCQFVGGITSPENKPAVCLMRRLGFVYQATLCVPQGCGLSDDPENGHVVYLADRDSNP